MSNFNVLAHIANAQGTWDNMYMSTQANIAGYNDGAVSPPLNVTTVQEAIDNLKVSVALLKTFPKEVSGVVIRAVDWTGTSVPFTNTVTVTGATATNDILVTQRPDMTIEQYNAFISSNIYSGGQGTNFIIVRAFTAKPTIDLPIAVTLLN